ncbi:hypothetical protein PFISCL1PPCAC_6523 [Pristionchus fissidentatus]|uniref:glucuronosyltransferase n=1 Tax=Pristionchus fissidentatus TaxID=1538716 RepID=A0AAV5V6I2_9BILA|nr:hypothetical protein PFISCL1PPCAC_6523 [Pristionchus fissidentatus]
MRLSHCVLILQLFVLSEPYKILVYSPSYAQSINNFIGNLADSLVEAGHHVTSVIPIINPSLRDGSHKSKKIYVNQTEEVKKITDGLLIDEIDLFDFNDFNPLTYIPFGSAFCRWFNAQCKGVLDEPGLVEKLKNEKYDVMLLETFDTCGIALSHLIKPKSLITTAGSIPLQMQGGEFGLDPALSYNPNAMISHLDIHSFSSRLWNIYAHFLFTFTWHTSRTEDFSLPKCSILFKNSQEIASHAAFSLINSEPLIDFAAPTLNRVICIGGIGAKEPKKLNKDLDSVLSLRNKTILISFGSIVVANKLPDRVKENFLKVISRFPEVTFIWKYEKPEDDFAKAAFNSTPNLQILSWTPQNDLLADERLTAFITHGGMASTQETALRGKPGLFIPFFFDQPRNSGMMEKNGLGKVFSKYDLLDEPKLYAAVKDLLENESYYQNAVRIAAMIRKKPFSARDQLVKSVEFAAQFGSFSSLRPKIFDMNWIELYNADIFVVLLSMITFLCFGLFKLSAICVRGRIVKVKDD